MVLFRGASAIGRYGGSSVSALFRNEALALQRAGAGVVQSRNLLRDVGFRFSNQAVTDLFREFRSIAGKSAGLRNIPLDFRPGINTVSRVNMSFRTRFQYTGIARLVDAETGIVQDVPVAFGDDRLLTRREIEERIRAIGEQVADKGGINYELANPTVDAVNLTSVLEGIL